MCSKSLYRLWMTQGLYDYSLFFVATLYDYYEATQDKQTLHDLWPVAYQQIEMALTRLDPNGLVQDDETSWCFIDWHTELNKQASAQAILLYNLKRGKILSEALGYEREMRYISDQINVVSAAARQLWDSEQCLFVSGANKQVSWASQIWMVLAEVLDEAESGQLMDRLFLRDPAIGMTTPYLYHHLIEALIISGRRERAIEQIRAYWGENVKDGAELLLGAVNPKDKKLSPYGSNLINSYCHAWSCTPAYFIRKYGLNL